MLSQIEDFRRDISKMYLDLPYHNWAHWRYVWDAMMKLEDTRDHVSPWRMAWYFHDVDRHAIVQEDDEERAAQIAHDELTNRDYDRSYIDQVKNYIMWTIFIDRWILIDPEQKLIADADLSKLGWDYWWFVKSIVWYLLETSEAWEITDTKIKDFFKNKQPGFFKHLTDMSNKENSPFLTQRASELYPHFSRNKDTLAEDIEKNPWKLISVVRHIESRPEIVRWREALI